MSSKALLRLYVRDSPELTKLGVGNFKTIPISEVDTAEGLIGRMKRLVSKGMNPEQRDKLMSVTEEYGVAIEAKGSSDLRFLEMDEKPILLVSPTTTFYFLSKNNRRRTSVDKPKQPVRNTSSKRLSRFSKPIKAPKDKPVEAGPTNDDLVQKDIIFLSMPAATSIEIKAGSLDRLVEFLTHESYTDPRFRNAFLLTYRSFCSGSELLEKLIVRFRATDLEAPAKISIRRIRTVAVFKAWMEDHYRDFEQDEQLTTDFQNFVGGEMQSLMEKSANQLSKVFENSKKNAERDREEKEAAEAAAAEEKEKNEGQEDQPKKTVDNWLDIDSQLLAEQMTFLESKYYCAITPKECIAWSKGKKAQAGNVSCMIDQFNRVSEWVVTEMCTRVKLEERIKCFEGLVSLAAELYDLQNFNGTMEILSGMNNSAVRRMKATWGGASKETMAKFDQIQKVMSHEHSYKLYRQQLHSIDPPLVPYLGMYLTDMVFIEEGNKDKQDGLINFAKRTKLGEVINEIKQYQIDYRRVIYIKKQHVLDWLQNLPSISDDDAYKFSVRVEPKNLNFEKAIATLIKEEAVLEEMLKQSRRKWRRLHIKLCGLKGEEVDAELLAEEEADVEEEVSDDEIPVGTPTGDRLSVGTPGKDTRLRKNASSIPTAGGKHGDKDKPRSGRRMSFNKKHDRDKAERKSSNGSKKNVKRVRSDRELKNKEGKDSKDSKDKDSNRLSVGSGRRKSVKS
mmetsp:Transcript_4765/g.13358  ORF Transcript_4765/g.13358 Transcript_4765/m.13358 type:complete len:731 (-) Transcript_4765:56-2248(-)